MADLGRLVDRRSPLRKHVDELRPAPPDNALAQLAEGFEQHRLRLMVAHAIKPSIQANA